MSVRRFGSNLTTKVASVVLAALLWFHVTTNESFSSKFSLPIQYVGPSEGYVLASDKPDRATVVIGGTGKDLAAFYVLGMLRSEKRYALVNMTGFPEGTNTVTLERNMVHLGLFSGLRIESILYPNNASFTIEVDKQIKRTVAVDTERLGSYKVADGYCVTGEPESKPAFVVLQGPEGIIEVINTVRVASMNKSTVSLSDSVFKARLVKPRFVEVEPEEVEISFRIEPVITKSISGIKLMLSGFPLRNRPIFDPDSLTVSFKGPKSYVSSLEAGNVVLAVEYKRYLDTKARGDSLITPSVTLPTGYNRVGVVDVVPRVVRFSAGS